MVNDDDEASDGEVKMVVDLGMIHCKILSVIINACYTSIQHLWNQRIHFTLGKYYQTICILFAFECYFNTGKKYQNFYVLIAVKEFFCS